MNAYYELTLVIPKERIGEALRIMNHLHDDEMLSHYAFGREYNSELNVERRPFYIGVPNPKVPYSTLEEAFTNWNIINLDVNLVTGEDGRFIIDGIYEGELKQQFFMIEQLTSVLNDTVIDLDKSDNTHYAIVIQNHTYRVFQQFIPEMEE